MKLQTQDKRGSFLLARKDTYPFLYKLNEFLKTRKYPPLADSTRSEILKIKKKYEMIRSSFKLLYPKWSNELYPEELKTYTKQYRRYNDRKRLEQKADECRQMALNLETEADRLDHYRNETQILFLYKWAGRFRELEASIWRMLRDIEGNLIHHDAADRARERENITLEFAGRDYSLVALGYRRTGSYAAAEGMHWRAFTVYRDLIYAYPVNSLKIKIADKNETEQHDLAKNAQELMKKQEKEFKERRI